MERQSIAVVKPVKQIPAAARISQSLETEIQRK